MGLHGVLIETRNNWSVGYDNVYLRVGVMHMYLGARWSLYAYLILSSSFCWRSCLNLKLTNSLVVSFRVPLVFLPSPGLRLHVHLTKPVVFSARVLEIKHFHNRCSLYGMWQSLVSCMVCDSVWCVCILREPLPPSAHHAPGPQGVPIVFPV